MNAFLIIASSIATVFTLIALFRLRKPGPAARRSGLRPPVLLIRPVDGPTPRELESLATPIDYRGPLQHVVVSPFRPRLPEGVRWVASDPLTHNRKVGHILYALEVLRPRNRRVLVVDADVAVTGALIDALVDGLDSGAALVTAPPSPFGGSGVGARAFRALLTQTHHSFIALNAMRAGAPAVCGKAVALSRSAQLALGDLGHHVGEDLELADRLHARGHHVAMTSVPALVPQARVNASDAFERATRWMQVLRAHRPALQPSVPSLFAPTLPLLAMALATSASSGAFTAIAALVMSRIALSFRLSQLHGVNASAIERATSWLLAEALLLGAFVASLRVRRLSWRGRTFQLAPGGVMRPVPSRLEVRAA